MVKSGTSLAYDVAGRAVFWWPKSADGVRQDVINTLASDFSVEQFTITPDRGWDGVSLQWDYRASLTVRPRSDYGSVTDIASVVANAFYQATNALPTISFGQGSQAPPIDRPPLLGLSASTLTIMLVLVAAIVIVPRVLPSR